MVGRIDEGGGPGRGQDGIEDRYQQAGTGEQPFVEHIEQHAVDQDHADGGKGREEGALRHWECKPSGRAVGRQQQNDACDDQ